MHLPPFGQYQVQLFLSLALVMSGLVAALICDYLKSNNEHLREQNTALRIQRAEARKRAIAARTRTALALKQSAASPTLPELGHSSADSLAQTLLPQSLIPQSRMSPSRIATGELAHESMEMVPVAAGSGSPAPAHAVGIGTGRARNGRSSGTSRRPISPDAMAVMQRGAAMAGSKHPTVSVAEVPMSDVLKNEPSTNEAAAADIPANVPAGIELSVEASHTASPLATIEPEAEEVTAPSQVILGRKRNWSALLSIRGSGNPVNGMGQQAFYMPQAPMSPSAAGGDVPVPAGFYDGYVLTRLVQSHQPLSGLVVSISVSAVHENGEPNLQSVRTMIQSLMGPQDFAAASAPDEYLLIFPQERGASAQRRLSQIAQQLWDFQLRTPGEASVLFSWGGVEVCGELIEDAIASASERMEETRRSRMARSIGSSSSFTSREGYRIAV